jgi:acyl transferase domain-containing protein/enoyl-CoA hydratase/carnithine racemase/acyl carrier protein
MRMTRAETLLLTPVWRVDDDDASGGASAFDYSEHHVVLCELSSVGVERLGAILPRSRFLSPHVRPGGSIAERYCDYALQCFEYIQSILRSRPDGKVLVQIVVSDDREHLPLTGLSGLLKTAALENPQISGQLILVPADACTEQLARLLEDEKARGRDPIVRHGQGARHVVRWQDLQADREPPPMAFKDAGVYLITGGLGGLGLLFAREILDQTRDARIVLMGRSAAEHAETRARLDQMSAHAGRVSYRQLDVCDPEQVTQLVAGIKREYGQLDGILHAAGLIADDFILKKESARFREVLAPKVTGTVNLDQASQDVQLDFFVMFSSIAGAMGNVGQADYAAANAFLDAFAAYRNGQVAAGQRWGRTRSIDWSLWQDGGMGIDPASRDRLQQTTGIQPMRTITGMEAFYRSLAWPYDQLLVAEGDLARMRRAWPGGRPVWPEPPAVAASVERSHAHALETATAGTGRDSLVERVEGFLRRECADLLKLPAQKLDPQAPLEKYGIDSILAMKLTDRLETTFGALSKTLFFEYHTIRQLTDYFIKSHAARIATLFAAPDDKNERPRPPADAPSDLRRPAPATPIVSRRSSRLRTQLSAPVRDIDPIAIIGLSGRYPEAIDLDAYWRHLRDGKDCITEVPRERWDWQAYFSADRSKSGHHYSKWGGFIAGVDEFDPLLFNISPKDAKAIDPQERLFLQHAWMAIEDAGYTRAGLQAPDDQGLAGQVGVYVGVMYSEYQLVGAEASLRGTRMGIAGSVASIANRVSYVLNLHGPSVALDTMCSSSLTAIHFACQDLALGRTRMAIAGGVNVSIHPNKYLVLSAGQFISSDGHCQSFGEGGDGYIPGEGVGVVVLKRLSEARRDGDHIYGIIRGSALNHGGKTNGYTVPNPHEQAGAIRRALSDARIDARQVSYIEAHGTGTKLGDPIEIAALSQAFRHDTQDTGFCLLGSCKANIGHCESAAGIAGLTKVLLQMQHRQIVPSLHSTPLNPHIDFTKTPFIVNQSLRPWEQPVIDGRTMPRIAGISSFGAGGSNAHLIVEEYQPAVREPMAMAPVAIPLSARTAGQLQQKARDLLAFIRARPDTIDLAALAYTLQVGRETMDERLGIVVRSVEVLADKLQAYAAGEPDVEDLYHGQIKHTVDALSVFRGDADLQQTVDRWFANQKLSTLIDLWVKGLELDWSRLYGETRPPRISLPTYPFARERYWIDTAAGGPMAADGAAAATAALHPLLHRNTSDLREQRYSSTFRGDELFLADCQRRAEDGSVHGALPAGAYLEMVRTALDHAMPERPEGAALELLDTVWPQTMVAGAGQEISMALMANDAGEIDYEIYSRNVHSQDIHSLDREQDQEIVLCYGRARVADRTELPALDLAQLEREMTLGPIAPDRVYAAWARMGLVYGPAFHGIAALHRGGRQLLASLRLPASVEDRASAYVLHPSVIESALQASVGLFGAGSLDDVVASRLPIALASLRIVSRCTREMAAWVRYSPGSEPGDDIVRVDIDLCDTRGTVCVQMQGLGWQQGALTQVEACNGNAHAASPATPVTRDGNPMAARAPKEIAFIEPGVASVGSTLAHVERKKPTGLSLVATGPAPTSTAKPSDDGPPQPRPSVGRLPVTLSHAAPCQPVDERDAAAASAVRLYDRGDGVFAIHIAAAPATGSPPAQDDVITIAHLRQAIDRVRQEEAVKVLMISGAEHCFVDRRPGEDQEGVEQRLYESIVSFPLPVIAALQHDTIGAGFLFAALCDFMVCSEEARYGYTDAQRLLSPTPSVAALFGDRFGDVLAQDLLFASTVSTGRQLRMKGWTCPFVPKAQVDAVAEELAAALATRSGDALRLLKQHLTRRIAKRVNSLTRVDAAEEATETQTQTPSGTDAQEMTPPATHFDLESPAAHVLVVTLRAVQAAAQLEDLVAEFRQIVAILHASPRYKAIVLSCESPDALSAAAQDLAADAVLEFRRLLAESPVPVVAAMDGNAAGEAWLIALCCDACVYRRTGVYSAGRLVEHAALASVSAAIFAGRFGAGASKEILLTGADYSGADLQRRTGTTIVAEPDDVLSTAVALAESCARLPRATLASWRARSAAVGGEIVRDVQAEWPAGWDEPADASEPAPAASTPVALRSGVVTATARPGGIVVVRMEDRDAKNMFSEALTEGLTEAFAHIERTPAYKVVILTGYDQYFASGGTKEQLLAIQAGTVKFTDAPIFQLPLDCRLPVIAAMQGHGIGAGWCMGMFADIVLLSEDGRYVSPYMNYGFTPGAGATWILPETIGHDLARESLLTARPSSGRALKDRGLLLPVLPHGDVYQAAMTMARQTARASRRGLVHLKQQWTTRVREALEETYRLELAMHERTFVGQSEALARIETNFHQDIGASPAVPAQTAAPPATVRADADARPSVTARLKTLLANELQMRESDVDDDAQFVDLGLDSIGGVSWIRRINETYRIAIEATKVYSYPTLAQLSRYVTAEAEAHGTLASQSAALAADMPVTSVTSDAPPPPPSPRATPRPIVTRASRQHRASRRLETAASAPAPAPRPSSAIAIVGMAGQFPQAKDLDTFWQNLAEGRNCITQVPRDRWDLANCYQPGDAAPGKTYSQWLGALEDYDRFDPLFFNISPPEAEAMDPQQRLFLQACWHGIESAGYDARLLSGSRCGVFVGCAAGDYHQLSRTHHLTAHGFTGNATSILASRIAYFLNLQGPCVSIDTACSSSLVAIAQACDSLNAGDSDLALAGGVYVMSGPDMHIRTSQAGMLSPAGKCFTFDARADGFVPGEAVGVVLLKRLADAERDQDIIHGVLHGWGVNQDGKTNGITAPNPESQARLEQGVYEKYQIDPANIQLIEAHGTATTLGDPIEVEALNTVFRRFTSKQAYCALGSVKSNIGHTLTAAGIAGVIKVLLSLKHRQLPPTINFERLNEHIDLTGSPFFVNTRLQEWAVDGTTPRLAAVSSFGFSGTNAHLVIGEHAPPAGLARTVHVAPRDTRTIVILSARTAPQLEQRARDLLDFIRKDALSASLAEIAWTLQVGRTAMDERLGFVVGSIEQLAARLQAYVNGERDLEDSCHGQVKRHKESLSLFSQDDDMKDVIVDRWIAQQQWLKLLDLWVKGLALDWNKLHGKPRPRRISLPLYPFVRDRYWIDTAAATQGTVHDPAPAGALTTVLHPLLHRNTSDLSGLRYSTTLTGEELFLVHSWAAADGIAGPVLPAVAYLEMARAAIEQALPARSESTVLELRDTVWARPLIVRGATHVTIELTATGHDEIDYEVCSQDAGQETVRCQGRAVVSRASSLARLDIARLAGQIGQIGSTRNGEVVATLERPRTADQSDAYVLHPSVMDAALRAAWGLTGVEAEAEAGAKAGAEASQLRWPASLDLLRIVAPCSPAMVAWARYASGSDAGHPVKLDIDLCDEQGNVCVQMRGLSSHALRDAIATTSAQEQMIGSLLATPMWQASPVRQAGDVVVSAGPGHDVDDVERHVVLCELTTVDAETLGALLPRHHCLSLDAGREQSIAQRYSAYALAGCERIQTILQAEFQGNVLVQIVAPDHQEQTLLAGLSGLLKTAALEDRRFAGQFILVPAQTTVEELATLLREESLLAQETLVRHGQDGRQVVRWHKVPEDSDAAPMAFSDRGVYLITGGLGALGLLFAREILGQTRQARVVLTGRAPLTADKQAILDGLTTPHGRASYRQLDLGDVEQATGLVAAIEDEHGPLNGILHCAGMVADDLIRKKVSARFADVLAPKVTGTYNLDEASRDLELEFFVVFSSIAAVTGNPGQADYAAANGFLDQFAAHRNLLVAAGRRHGRTRSINWPLWDAGGMRIDLATRELLQLTTGMRPMQTATGMRAFHRSLALPCDQTLVMEGVTPKITSFLQSAGILSQAHANGPVGPDRSAQAGRRATVDLNQLHQELKVLAATVLRIEPSSIDVDQPFVEFGVDSFLGAELILAINKKYGTGLSHITLFDYTTVREFAGFLEQQLPQVAGDSVPVPVTTASSERPLIAVADTAVPIPILEKRRRAGRTMTPHRAHLDDKIAIVGMSGRYPKAQDVKQFWNNLVEGRNCIEEVPRSRWDVDRYYDPDRARTDTTYSKWLGALDDVECFDPLFFRISPQEAEHMDPQHRLFLQESYRAFEDAGYCSSSLSNTKCGVYLGVTTNEYTSLLLRRGVSAAPVTSNNGAIAAARIAYYLNLKGPAIAVDTACSSSLVAVHLASQALLNGEIDMALAGGVTAWLTPESYLAMSQAGMFSPVGQCKTFDETADGIVNGEGVGAVVLKRLRDAQADHDFIYGVILGSGINQDGKTNGITAPSVRSQIELERGIYARYGIDPETIGYVEAHGTGTKLGDPIELEALATVFRERTARTGFCALGSVKSNIGHTTAAAGVAGLHKVLLSLQHRTLVPTLNVTRPNPRFDVEHSPFYISRETRPWDVEAGSLRRAAVSSFGFSGTNSHLVVEEYPAVERAAPASDQGPVIVPLSARTAEQLRQRARDLSAFIRTAPQPIDLAAMACTLQIGRDAMEERVGFVVTSVDQLAEKLSAFVSGQKDIEGCYQGRVEPGDESMTIIGRDDDMQGTIERWIARRKFSKLLEVWSRGLQIDWSKLHGGAKPRRIPLPTYPFAKERYWIDETPRRPDPERQMTAEAHVQAIEDIINQVGDDAIDTEQAIHALKMLV